MHPSFRFERQRGVVWVCDFAGSSQYLNNDLTADALEEFLPRLHWVSRMAVNAAGGKFVKWTGDGFLAWFETPLQRNAARQAADVFEAAWNLTILVNVTNLGIRTESTFRIRHGVTYEADALVTTLDYSGIEFSDLIGRSVVLAFRLSGIRAAFPCIVTQKDLVVPNRKELARLANFKSRKFTPEERQRYFKGEPWGTSGIYVSADRRPRARSTKAVLAQVKKAISKAKTQPKEISFSTRFINSMISGPTWCSIVIAEYARFIRDDLLGSLESLVPLLEKDIQNE